MTDPLQYVPRPRDLDRASLRELAEGYGDHQGALVSARYGVGEREPDGRLQSSALDALAIGAQVEQRMKNERWSTVADALTYGATVDKVAVALGIDRADVVQGVTRWAAGQLDLWQAEDGAFGISPEEHARVLDLLPDLRGQA